jgi:hypothetical protein
MEYKPYSPEWNRKRYLREALETYFNNYVDIDVIYNDLMDILHEKSELAYSEFSRINELESRLNKS